MTNNSDQKTLNTITKNINLIISSPYNNLKLIDETMVLIKKCIKYEDLNLVDEIEVEDNYKKILQCLKKIENNNSL